MTTALIRKAVVQLRSNKAIPRIGELYAAYVHPRQSADLRAESGTDGFQELTKYVERTPFAEKLGAMGPDAVSAVPKLLALLTRDTDSESAAEALRQIDSAPPEAVPQLVEMLRQQNSNRRVRFFSLHLLRKTGPAAKTALPALRELLPEVEGRARESLEGAIRDIEEIP